MKRLRDGHIRTLAITTMEGYEEFYKGGGKNRLFKLIKAFVRHHYEKSDKDLIQEDGKEVLNNITI